MDYLRVVLVVVITAMVGGQLIVAAALKIRGFGAYTAAIGSKRAAHLVVAGNFVLGSWCLLARPYGQIMWVAVGAFFTLGAVHRARVVLSPSRISCLCAHPAKGTEWPDVASNIVIAITAVLVGALHWKAPAWFTPIAITAELSFICACVHAGFRGRGRDRIDRLSHPSSNYSLTTVIEA